MPLSSRRSFLKTAFAVAGVGLTARFTASALAQPVGANGDLRLAVIGLGIKGWQLAEKSAKTPGVRLAAICDVDGHVLAERAAALAALSPAPFATTDLRRILERPDIDAVIIATSTHWHALATIWALQAGKDVYLEKPIGLTVWEGRQIVAAAARHGRIVQAGTQLRSDAHLSEAIALVRSGEFGKIQWIHALTYKQRDPIGQRLPWYPDWLDYDLFCGPTPAVPLQRAQLHYDWHWMWDTGNGDLVNMGIHMIDVGRRFLGDDAKPRRAYSMGGRYATHDAGETPNTQFTILDFPAAPLYFENRGLSAKPGVRYADQFRGLRDGVVVQCEHGYYAGYYGGAFFDNAGKKIRTKQITADGGARHLENFFATVRSRDTARLAAPIIVGHDSSRFSHYGNLAFRIGSPAPISGILGDVGAFPQAPEVIRRLQVHLETHQIDLARQPFTRGQWLELDQTGDGIDGVSSGDPAALAHARFLLRGVQRPQYQVPAYT